MEDDRREKIHRLGRRPQKRSFDTYLDAGAVTIAALWQRLALQPVGRSRLATMCTITRLEVCRRDSGIACDPAYRVEA